MLGRHLIKSWSTTQPLVSLSSGEAEFYGVARASGIGLDYQAMASDLGLDLPPRIWTDSTAALGICNRQGPDVKEAEAFNPIRRIIVLALIP